MKDKIKWVDITRHCRVSHYDDDPGRKILERAYIYDVQDGNILWNLRDKGWARCALHLDGHHYRTSKGRIYRREP
jgi:hypothetical protein